MRQYPALLPLTAVVTAILAADMTGLSSWLWLLLGLTGVIVSLTFTSRHKAIPAGVAASLAIGVLAAAHYAHDTIDPSPRRLRGIVDERRVYSIYGVVDDWPNLKPDRTEIVVSIDSLVDRTSRRVEGHLLLRVNDTTTRLQRGDRLGFKGRIYKRRQITDHAGFDYARFLQLKGIDGTVYLPTLIDVRVDRRSRYGFFALVDNLRQSILSSFRRNLEAVPAALSSGFLLGETRDIPPEIYRRFRDSGTLHLLAVSGSNVALVLLVGLFALRPLGLRPRSRLLALQAAVLVFVFLSYAEPSVVRASVMASLVLIGRLLGRRFDLNHIISLTALIILLWSPQQLYDIGFQLSFVTAWGLIFMVPRLLRRWEKDASSIRYRFLLLPITVALVAQIVSAPLIVLYFDRFPVISFAANLVIVPLVSLAVIGGLLLLLADLVWPLFGLAIGSGLNLYLKFLGRILEFFAGDTFPNLTTFRDRSDASVMFAVSAVYLILLTGTAGLKSVRFRRYAVLLILISLNVGLVWTALSNRDRGPTVIVDSVPGGAVLLYKLAPAQEADLVVCSARQTDYPLDERVLLPLLQTHAISHLNRLFVLSAEFGAVDDLLRFAAVTEASTFYVDDYLRPAFRDQIRRTDVISDSIPVQFFSGRVPAFATDGWYVGRGKVDLVVAGARFACRREISADDDSAFSDAIVVAGRPYHPLPDEWLSLVEQGATRIVCSKIDQFLREDNFGPPEETDLVLPDLFTDLRYEAPVRFRPGRRP